MRKNYIDKITLGGGLDTVRYLVLKRKTSKEAAAHFGYKNSSSLRCVLREIFKTSYSKIWEEMHGASCTAPRRKISAELIKKEIDRGLTVPSIAALYKLDQSTISKRFRAEYNITVTEYRKQKHGIY